MPILSKNISRQKGYGCSDTLSMRRSSLQKSTFDPKAYLSNFYAK
jgi:hypothetical protein